MSGADPSHRRQRGVARLPRHREGNDLDGRDHLAGNHRLVGRQGREGDRLVDLIEPIDRVLVDHQHAGALGEQIGAAGEGAVDPHPLARDRGGDLGGGGVLRDVARLEPRHHDLGDAGGLERGDLGLADQGALLEHQAGLADRMHRDPALGLGDRHRAEFHDAFSSAFSAAGCAQPRGDLAHDRDRDLGRRHRADGKPDRRVDARQRGVADALRLEPLEAAAVRLLRAERADVEAVARERMGERRVVDLGVVGERHEGRVVVDAERRQRHVRPFGDHLDVGEALDRGEGGAGIDDGDVVAEQPADRRQRLADMHRAGDHELRRRDVHGEEDLALRRLLHAALAAADMLLDERLERIARHVRGLHQPLRAARHVGDDHRRAPRRALGVQRPENVELHVAPRE